MLRERHCRSDRGLAEAVEASVICDASASHYLHILAEHPLRMARVAMTMGRHIFQMERTIERMSTQRVRARVATVLVELAEGRCGSGVSRCCCRTRRRSRS